MDYLKLFQTHEEYEAFVSGGTMVKPNVSHCVAENEVHYHSFSWADVYFTTVARGSGEISFNIRYNMGTDMITSISYSTDNGETWNTTNNANDKEENIVISVNVEEGDKVMWKGNATQYGYFDEDEELVLNSFFSSTCEFVAQGNVMSLLYGDDFKGETTIENEYALAGLFSDFYQETLCDLVNAKNLSLPATTLAKGCYYYMFRDCTSLTTAPELPATALAESCYQRMFQNCASLTEAPELPATTLAESCYEYMFVMCRSITIAPKLPATTLANGCYEGMFHECRGLTEAPKLPATTLAEGCYNHMFWYCTNLTVAPTLPATTLANRCYTYMFSDCTSLTTAPKLPATTLAEGCYSSMFYGCTSLTTAPELPATTLANRCYYYMFNGCTNLNSITCLATDISATDCTRNWVYGVAANGTFTKAASMSSWTTGVNGIPTNWTVQDAS